MPLRFTRRFRIVPGLRDLCTLGDIAARTSMLEVGCSRCDRHGRYRLDTLIAGHGADAGARVIVVGFHLV